MRFNPDTERAINIDEIAAQCKAAVEQRYVEQVADRIYDEILTFNATKVFRMKDYGSLITA
tara:strand:- start:2979 stop:3161 length:183 start_codon:yes stop_codon:yes gene_type:complete